MRVSDAMRAEAAAAAATVYDYILLLTLFCCLVSLALLMSESKCLTIMQFCSVLFLFMTTGKRVAETMMYAYESQGNVEVRVARIFNTFGPRMHPNDGRVVSNFIIQVRPPAICIIIVHHRHTSSSYTGR
jgi:hypothetical protein